MMANPKIVLDTKGLQALKRKEPEKVATWLDMKAEGLVTDIKLSFNTSPPGRTYTRGGVSHTASQEGYPPNVDIGTLRLSIRWERDGLFRRKIMDGVNYGIHLEDGTERIAPRPFMQPAFKRLEQTIEADAKSELGLEDL
jgi:hypothetical protein